MHWAHAREIQVLGAGQKLPCRMVASDAREIDIVVWGATGLTGRLMCEHLAQHAPAEIRWKIAGRSEPALARMLSELSGPGVRCSPKGVLVGDAKDAEAAARIAKSTLLVLAAAGPFHRFSAAILRACVAQGTHYVDITGEIVPYVRESVADNHAAAAASGAKIVHCAGFDSVPSDLLSCLAIERLSGVGQRCEFATVGFDSLATRGGISGGTIHSIMDIVEHLQTKPSDVPAALDSHCLWPGRPARTLISWLHTAVTGGDAWWLPGRSSALGGEWHFLFGMAIANTRIVRRTRFLLRDAPEHFTYREVMTCGRGLWGALLAVASTLAYLVGSLFVALPPVRRLVRKLFPSGSGPSTAAQRNGAWRAAVAAGGSRGGVVRGEAVALRQDPGYRSTSIMASQVALALLDVAAEEKRGGAAAAGSASRADPADPADPAAPATWRGGGVLTPVAACGTRRLVERLGRHGITVSVELVA